MPIVKLDYTNTKVQDTFTNVASPSTVFNTVEFKLMGENRGKALAQFDMGLIPNNANINSAVLSYFCTAGVAGSVVEVRKVLAPWSQLTLNHNTKPAIETLVSGTHILTGNYNSVDIRTLVQEWIDNDNNNGLALSSSAGDITFSSNEVVNTVYRPYLTIDYTIPTVDKKQVEVVGKTEFSAISSAEVAVAPLKIPTGTQKGDLLITYVTDNSAADLVTPVGWSRLSRGLVVSNIHSTVFYKFAGDNEPDYTLTPVGGQSINWAVLVQGYRNVKAVAEGSPFVHRDSAGNHPNDITINGDNNLMILFLSVSSSTGISTQPLNFSKVVDLKASGWYETVSHSYTHKKRNYIATTDLRTTVASGAVNSGVRALLLEPITNEVPKIDGKDEDLGTLSTPLVKPYNVTDTESDVITVVEKLNGVPFHTVGGGAQSLDLTSQWSTLAIGKHTVTIEASDDYDTTRKNVRTWTFTKILDAASKKPEIVKGLSDLVPFLEGVKADLVAKVGGSSVDTFENIIENIKIGSMKAKGVTISGAVLEVRGLGFKPSAVFFVSLDNPNTYNGYAADIDGVIKAITKYGQSARFLAPTFYEDGFSVDSYEGGSRKSWVAYE